MAKQSAGILLYRRTQDPLEVFLVHPGGPYWWKKDAGAWSIPKGEYEDGEDALSAAKREFQEETGFSPPGSALHFLGDVRLASRKTVSAWAASGDCDAGSIRSNTFCMEWPPKSGKQQQFPEVDRAEWFPIPQAHQKIHSAQREFLTRLTRILEINDAE